MKFVRCTKGDSVGLFVKINTELIPLKKVRRITQYDDPERYGVSYKGIYYTPCDEYGNPKNIKDCIVEI